MKLSIRYLSEALVKPHQAHDAYWSLDTITDLHFVNLLKHSINRAVCSEDFHGIESLCTRADIVL